MVRRLLLAALCAGPMSAAGQEPPVPPPEGVPASPPHVWEIACRPDAETRRLGCVLSQTLIVPETGGRILRVDVIPAVEASREPTVMRLLFPHGLRLDAVVGLRIDDGQLFRVPLTRSAPEGVYAIHPLGRDVVEGLRRGRILTISAIAEDGKVLTLPVSLFGFTAALDAIGQIQSPAPAAP